MGADPDGESGPERTCIVTRAKGSPEGMIRFVLGPDAAVVPDIRCKLPGRGVWVTGRADLVRVAVARQAFARSFKAKVTAAPTLADDIAALFERDALQALSLANKAGLVTTGFAKVEAAVGAGRVRALIHAAGAGPDGIRKLGQAARRAASGTGALEEVRLFAGPQMDLALGRTNVIHAALAAGSASEAFLARCRRLSHYLSAAAPEQNSNPNAAGGAEQAGASAPAA